MTQDKDKVKIHVPLKPLIRLELYTWYYSIKYRLNQFNIIFYILLGLIGLDFITTFTGILILDITEGNPLFYQLGFVNFFIVKLIATIGALIILYYMKKYNPNISMAAVLILCGWYGAVFVNNVYIIGCAIYE